MKFWRICVLWDTEYKHTCNHEIKQLETLKNFAMEF